MSASDRTGRPRSHGNRIRYGSEAQKASFEDETPIGCVIVKDDKVIARGFNHRESRRMVISHAEIEAIRKASKKLNDWVKTILS